jgi:DNA-binding transcriptional MerR regulator
MTGIEGPDVRFPWEESDAASGAAQPSSAPAAGPTGEQPAGPDVEPWASAPGAEPQTDAADDDTTAAVEGETAGAAAARDRPIATREYYAISEVCDLVDLKPHVLRYWETQFGVLNPSKNRSGNRVYQRKEIKLILLVKHLLYEEKYTVEGAKQKLERMRRGGELPAATAGALDRQTIELLRSELRRLSELLTPPEAT